MNNRSPFSERILKAFAFNSRGVVGLVDDLLEMCPEQGLHLELQANQCRVCSLDDESHESTEISVQKSVFRAILARLAALCNERTANSVSPYGGEGELSVCTNPPTVFRVVFTNTPGEQRLELRRVAVGKNGTMDDSDSEGVKQSN